MVRFTLSKDERLSSGKAIEKLFGEGHSLARFPVRIIWREITEGDIGPTPVRVMFSVSKKKFPSAVKRNRIKRLMREAYRHEKPNVYAAIGEGRHYHLAILFSGQEMPDLTTIHKSLAEALQKWLSRQVECDVPSADAPKVQS